MKRLTPVEFDNLIQDTINSSMSGNEGLAVIKLRKKLQEEYCPALRALNTKLIQIEIDARIEMKLEITRAILTMEWDEEKKLKSKNKVQ